MAFTTTISKSGQITLPKDFRNALGVDIGDQVTLDLDKKDKTKVVLARQLTPDEFIKQIDQIMGNNTPKTQRLIKKHSGKTINQLRQEWDTSPTGQSYHKEKYDINQ